MKKILIATLIVGLFGFVGCTNNIATSNESIETYEKTVLLVDTSEEINDYVNNELADSVDTLDLLVKNYKIDKDKENLVYEAEYELEFLGYDRVDIDTYMATATDTNVRDIYSELRNVVLSVEIMYNDLCELDIESYEQHMQEYKNVNSKFNEKYLEFVQYVNEQQ